MERINKILMGEFCMEKVLGFYYEKRLIVFLVLSILSLITFFTLQRNIAMHFIAICILVESMILFFANLWVLPEENRKVHLSVFVLLLAVVFCGMGLTNSFFGIRFSGALAFFSFSMITFVSCCVKLIRLQFIK